MSDNIKKEIKTTSKMIQLPKDHKEECTLYTSWWVPTYNGATYANSDVFIYDEGRDSAYEWVKILAKNRTSKRLYWFSPYSIKHDVEKWTPGNPNKCYVSRDMVTASALLLGLPVNIDSADHNNNQIGLYMTRIQYQKLAAKSGVTKYSYLNYEK
jgi:hypothetical protein